MIRDLDTTLQNLLSGEAASGSELASATISFAAPDKEWRGTGSGLALDLYLYRVLENTELRSNERRRTRLSDGTIVTEAPPLRVECSYLITAWNKGVEMSGTEKERQEHRLLSQAIYVLLRNPVIPRGYLAPGLVSQDPDLPAVSAINEDTSVRPDFWSGLETYLRPSITCKVTLSLDLQQSMTTPEVTAANYQVSGEQLWMIGGTIVGTDASGVPGAWVRVDETASVYVSDAVGHYRVDRIAAGAYTITVRATGFQEASLSITVPGSGNAHDVILIPLS